MSLTRNEQEATKAELQEALAVSGLSIQQVAEELGVTSQVIEDTLNLNCRAIENPWVLKEFLADEARKQGKEPVFFTALKGDYHRYWFLNARVIDERKMR